MNNSLFKTLCLWLGAIAWLLVSGEIVKELLFILPKPVPIWLKYVFWCVIVVPALWLISIWHDQYLESRQHRRNGAKRARIATRGTKTAVTTRDLVGHQALIVVRLSMSGCLIVFLLASLSTRLVGLMPFMIFSVLMLMFVDAILSFYNPIVASRPPKQPVIAFFFSVSFFSRTDAPRAYMICMICLLGVLTLVSGAKVLDFW